MSEEEQNCSQKANENNNDGKSTNDSGSIKIVLQGSHDNKTTVKAKPSTKAIKLLNAYCKDRKISPQEYRLIYKGKVMLEEEEISTYGIQEGSVIEVVALQTGGFKSKL